MKYLALKDLPNRVEAGTTFECHPDEFAILQGAGLATTLPDTPADEPPAKGRYRRRDLKAKDSPA